MGSYFSAYDLAYWYDDDQALPFVKNWLQVWLKSYENLALSAGVVTLSMVTVPADELIHLKNLDFFYTGTVPTRIAFSIYDGTTSWYFYVKEGIVTNNHYSVQLDISVPPTYQIAVTIVSATLNDDIHVNLIGYRYKLKSS